MVRKKRVIFYLIVSFILVVLIVASPKYDAEKKTDIFQFLIYPTNISGDTYLYSLSEDGVLRCTMGERRSDDIKKRNIIKKVEYSSETVLDEKDVQILIGLACELEYSGFRNKERRFINSSSVVLLYNGEVYKMNYIINDSIIFQQLADKIIELSPIPVKIRSYA